MNQCQPSLLSHICISRSPTRFPTKAQQIGRHFHPTGPCPNCSLSNYLCNEIRRASVVLAGDLTFTWSGHQTDSQSWCQQDCQRGLRVARKTCPPIDCVTDCIVGWSIYKLGNSSHVVHYGHTWKVGISTVFKRPLTVPCTGLTTGKCLPLGLCKETVEEFTKVWKIVLKGGDLWSGGPRNHLSYLILPYPTLSYPILPYPTQLYPTLPCPALPCPTLPCPTLPYPNLT